jgi:hypothetical protein
VRREKPVASSPSVKCLSKTVKRATADMHGERRPERPIPLCPALKFFESVQQVFIVAAALETCPS